MKQNLPVTQQEKPFIKGKYIVSKTDLKGAITYANDAFIEMSGFTHEELIGKNHNLVRHPDVPPQAFADFWANLKEDRPWRGIVKNRAKNGDHYWVDALVVPVRKDNQTIGYMSVRTEPTRRQIEAAEAVYQALNASGKAIPWQIGSITGLIEENLDHLVEAEKNTARLKETSEQLGRLVAYFRFLPK